jgi:hypothetical protein
VHLVCFHYTEDKDARSAKHKRIILQDLISGVVLKRKCHTQIVSIRHIYGVNSTGTAADVRRRGRIYVLITKASSTTDSKRNVQFVILQVRSKKVA